VEGIAELEVGGVELFDAVDPRGGEPVVERAKAIE